MFVRKKLPVLLLVLLLLCGLAGCSAGEERSYDRARAQGYGGTAEQFAAALVGECAENAGASAYELARAQGYTGTEGEWISLLTGAEGPAAGKSAYEQAVAAGYTGDLAQWVSEQVPDPQSLGRSQEGEARTEYELALAYGFEGTFVQWLVSLIQTP